MIRSARYVLRYAGLAPQRWITSVMTLGGFAAVHEHGVGLLAGPLGIVDDARGTLIGVGSRNGKNRTLRIGERA